VNEPAVHPPEVLLSFISCPAVLICCSRWRFGDGPDAPDLRLARQERGDSAGGSIALKAGFMTSIVEVLRQVQKYKT